MLRLGEHSGTVVKHSYIGMVEEANRRKRFFEADQFEAVLQRLPDDLTAVFEVAYITGRRAKDEILSRQKCHLALKAGCPRLEPGETKNGEDRMFLLWTVPRLRDVLERQIERTEAIERRQGESSPGSSIAIASLSDPFAGRGSRPASVPGLRE